VQEDFASPKYDFWRDLKGGAKKILLRSLALAIFYFSLINYDITRRLHQTPYLDRRDVPSHSSSLFGISILGALGASSVVPPLFIPNYTAGWAPGLSPAKSGPEFILLQNSM